MSGLFIGLSVAGGFTQPKPLRHTPGHQADLDFNSANGEPLAFEVAPDLRPSTAFSLNYEAQVSLH